MLVLGPGQQGMQSMAKLMDQGGCTAVMQHPIWLVKAEGQGNDWCLVLPILQLASTPQCEVGCTRKLALPACRAFGWYIPMGAVLFTAGATCVVVVPSAVLLPLKRLWAQVDTKLVDKG